MPSAMPCSLSPLISRIQSFLFSNWRRTVSSKFFDTQVPSISTEELVLPRHARCVLSRLRCNGQSLLLSSYLSRFGRIENPSCSACGHPSQDTSHLILHCPATDSLRCSLFGDCLSSTSGPGPGEFPSFWGSMVFRHAPSLGRGRVINNNATIKHDSQEQNNPNLMLVLNMIILFRHERHITLNIIPLQTNHHVMSLKLLRHRSTKYHRNHAH